MNETLIFLGVLLGVIFFGGLLLHLCDDWGEILGAIIVILLIVLFAVGISFGFMFMFD
jgi:hypothetical protein